jgi:RNA polymerase sigma factor (sigma-70 family)
MQTYKEPALKQLADQLKRFTPVDIRLEQMDNAERLLTDLDPDKSYTYRELCQNITSFSPKMYPDLKIQGSEAAHDLQLMIEDLSRSADLPAERAGEPVLTVDDLTERFNVSTKTIDRWRKRGLVSRRFKFGNRTRLGFLESSVNRFVENHENEIERGARFSQIDDLERAEIVDRARRLMAERDSQPSDVVRELSEQFGRSPDTIRQTLKRHDRENPEDAVMPATPNPLDDRQREAIYEMHQDGQTVDAIARRFGRTRSTIYRVVGEMRAEDLLTKQIDYMDSAEFHKPNADRLILAAPPESEGKASRLKAPAGLPSYLASLYSLPLLTREEEGYYFRKMNYLKFQASKLQARIDAEHPRSRDLDKLEDLLKQAVEVKSFLIRSNLRLVVSIAKRHIRPGANFFEMVSDGNMSLIRAIEKFDYTKGNKFSTYATWAIMKNFARTIPAENNVLNRFRTGNDEIFFTSSDSRPNPYEAESVNSQQHEILMSILDQLEDREREIIVRRYGLASNTEPETLEEVGHRFGVTKERVRQIESRTIQKIRKLAIDERLDIPGV